jgi:hypothetical protein
MKWMVISLSLQQPVFKPSEVRVGFVADKVALVLALFFKCMSLSRCQCDFSVPHIHLHLAKLLVTEGEMGVGWEHSNTSDGYYVKKHEMPIKCYINITSAFLQSCTMFSFVSSVSTT